MSTETPERVIEKARQLLKGSASQAAASLAVSDEYLQEGSWLQLIVYPTREGLSALEYVDEIESIERELRQLFGTEIMIAAAKP